MNWENGLHVCDGCGGEFASDELQPVIGGVDTDYCESAPGQYVEWLTGKRVEMTPEQYERSHHFYSISFCEDCCKQRDGEIARRLLAC